MEWTYIGRNTWNFLCFVSTHPSARCVSTGLHTGPLPPTPFYVMAWIQFQTLTDNNWFDQMIISDKYWVATCFRYTLFIIGLRRCNCAVWLYVMSLVCCHQSIAFSEYQISYWILVCSCFVVNLPLQTSWNALWSYLYICRLFYNVVSNCRPPLWSSAQSSWL
jgi:hypothetical protein